MSERTFHSVTGAPEMAEPSTALTTPAERQSSVAPSTTNPQSSTSSLPTVKKVFSPQTTSATTSPRPSRESSPIRPELASNAQSRSGSRSRKNSTHEPSPTRSASATTSIPSSATFARKAFTGAAVPQLRSTVSDTAIKSPIPQKISLPLEAKDLPRWPVSPRLRSPPPVIKALTSPRKADQETPTINVQTTNPANSGGTHTVTESEDPSALSGMRSPVRGPSGAGSTLETVQEMSQPSTPAINLDGSRELSHDAVKHLLEHGNVMDQVVAKPLKSKSSATAGESGSESGGNKVEAKQRAATLAPPPVVASNVAAPTKSHSTGSAVSRGKAPGEGSAKNMTVETETVSSIPQVAVGGGTGGVGNNGSIRAKPSSETIRPKKDKKKTTRKAPSVTSGIGEPPDLSSNGRRCHHSSARSFSEFNFISPAISRRANTSSAYSFSGAASPRRRADLRRYSLNLYNVSSMLTRTLRTASSKADIFEAKIASAVDEANSSDSEETFVYESNPPEVNERPRRYHSRTPSATSMASQIDQRGNPRSIHGVLDGVHGVAMKKSMKFANNNTNAPDSTTGEDDGKGTVRSNIGTGRGTTHHHHIGRWGRNGGNGHSSLFDNESPFPNATKSRLGGTQSRNSSRPTSPRVSNNKFGNGKKTSPESSGYDIDDGTRADDERTPLMGSTVRSARSGRSRRQPLSSLRQLEQQESRSSQGFLSRFAGCLVLSIMILLVISGAIGFLFATTQPLTEVEVVALQHVVATEDELILDMKVRARNPNIVVISVESTDIDIFAKSKHSDLDSYWWSEQQRSSHVEKRRRSVSTIHTFDDSPDDPFEDPDETKTVLLGRVFFFDSPLIFNGSPFKHTLTNSTGELRLAKPGNTSETDNSKRWQRILKYEYELILKGTLKYQLPMNSRVRNVSIDARLKVTPSSDDKKMAGGYVLID